MKPTCMLVRSFAPSGAEVGLPERLDRHVTTCLSCQAEMARYGRLRRSLAAMAETVEPAPQSVASTVADEISSEEEIPAGRERSLHLARVAATAGAVAAATAGAVAIWRQSRAIV